MTVDANATHEQVDLAVGFDFRFVLAALGVNVRCITIQQVDIFAWDINVIKEITVHEGMIAFRVFLRQANVFIHVESHHMLKAYFTCFVHRNQMFVGFQRSTAGWQAEHKRTLRSRLECVDALDDMAGGPFADLCSIFQWDKSHLTPLGVSKLKLYWFVPERES
ncbi:hypothetical protein D3C78_1127840 [compost metagenome]